MKEENTVMLFLDITDAYGSVLQDKFLDYIENKWKIWSRE